LTTENSLLASDVGGSGWVKPNSAAQAYTNIMHDAVMSFAGKYPNVEVFDLMAAEYGQIVKLTSPLMADQLHPNALGQTTEADLIAALIGLPPGTVN
jgi:lysophospholipase L1-like esterase